MWSAGAEEAAAIDLMADQHERALCIQLYPGSIPTAAPVVFSLPNPTLTLTRRGGVG